MTIWNIFVCKLTGILVPSPGILMILTHPNVNLFCNSFVPSNVRYGHLVWMLYLETAKKVIIMVHKRARRSLLKNYDASIDEQPIRIDKSTVNVQYLQKLMKYMNQSVKKIRFSYGVYSQGKTLITT